MSRLGNVGGALYRGEVSVDFVGRRKTWYRISGAILIIAIAAVIFRGLTFSVDFKGGEIFKFTTASGVTQSQVTSTAVGAGSGPTITVQRLTTPGSAKPSWDITTPVFSKDPKVNQTIEFKIQDAIAARFGVPRNSISLQSVGPTWGRQILSKALEALILFLVVIVAYLSLAFEWRMATAAFVALLHDIVITVGVYALFGFQVSPATVIGLLTILGYSLYDTVVVFDKVRENTAGLLATRRSTYSEAANLALNQTLVRSINTSLTALLPVGAILAISVFLLGNGELKDLSLVLFVGMLSGTYSSICIATPVLADLKEREPEFRQLAEQVARRATSVKRQEKVAVAGSGTPAVAPASAGDPPSEPDASEPEATERGATASLAAGRPAGSAGSGAGRAMSGPRQQPRRSSAAQRRPSGKKKRR